MIAWSLHILISRYIWHIEIYKWAIESLRSRLQSDWVHTVYWFGPKKIIQDRRGKNLHAEDPVLRESSFYPYMTQVTSLWIQAYDLCDISRLQLLSFPGLSTPCSSRNRGSPSGSVTITVIVETALTNFQVGHVIAGHHDFSVAVQEQERKDDLGRCNDFGRNGRCRGHRWWTAKTPRLGLFNRNCSQRWPADQSSFWIKSLGSMTGSG